MPYYQLIVLSHDKAPSMTHAHLGGNPKALIEGTLYPKGTIFKGDISVKVAFKSQKLCKLPSISIVRGWDQPRPGKAFILPIIDRIIACDEADPPNIIPAPCIYYDRPEPKTHMFIPVSGLLWRLKYWEVKYITLTSPDRNAIKMHIANETFDLTDEQLVCLIY